MKATPAEPLTTADIVDEGVRAIQGIAPDINVVELRERVAQVAGLAYRLGGKASLDTILTARQVADELGVSRAWVTVMARDNHIGTILGREWMFRPEDRDEMRRIVESAVRGRRKSHYRLMDGPARKAVVPPPD